MRCMHYQEDIGKISIKTLHRLAWVGARLLLVCRKIADFETGQTKFVGGKSLEGQAEAETLISPFVTASGPRWASMKSRMGWTGEI